MTRRSIPLVLLALASGCYASHGREGASDAAVPAGALPYGVVFDHPEGRFREVILTEEPIACDLVEYSAMDSTGHLRDPSVLPWLSLVAFGSGYQSYMYHDERSNYGPGPADFTIADRAAIGEPLPVRYRADIVAIGVLEGTSRPIYCGVLTLRR